MNLIGIGWMKVLVQPNIDSKSPPVKHLHVHSNILPEKFDIRKVLNQFINNFPPKLRWMRFYKQGLMTAEVLMSAEFVQLQMPILTVKEVEKNDPLPMVISPDIRKFRMEVIFAGIRNAAKLSHFASGRFKIELNMGELKLSSGFSGKAMKKNLNFLDPYASGYLLLPEQFQFWPPIIVKHLDCSHKNPIVTGASMIRRPEKFFFDEKPKELQRFLLNQYAAGDVEAQKTSETFEIEENEPLLGISNVSSGNFNIRRAFSKLPSLLNFSKKVETMTSLMLEREYTWWTKFYNSNRQAELKNDCMHSLTVSCSLNFYIFSFKNIKVSMFSFFLFKIF